MSPCKNTRVAVDVKVLTHNPNFWKLLEECKPLYLMAAM